MHSLNHKADTTRGEPRRHGQGRGSAALRLRWTSDTPVLGWDHSGWSCF